MALFKLVRNIRSFGFNDMLLPFNIVNLFIQRLLTYDYRTPYLLRNTLYRAINLWNARLNKYVLPSDSLQPFTKKLI